MLEDKMIEQSRQSTLALFFPGIWMWLAGNRDLDMCGRQN